MSLSTHHDMVAKAEQALRRGDLTMADLYLKRGIELTRQHRLTVTRNPLLGAQFAAEAVVGVFNEQLKPAVEMLSGVIREFSKTFLEAKRPSQDGFTLQA